MKRKYDLSQQGGSKLSAVIALVVVGIGIFAAVNFIPAAYQIMNFKTEMRNAVIQVMATPRGNEKPNEKIKTRVRRVATENGVPADAVIDVLDAGKNVQTRVRFTRMVDIIPFGIYKYKYDFDETVTEGL